MNDNPRVDVVRRKEIEVAKTIETTIHKVSEDGLPDVDKLGSGRVAFIFDGAIISGCPLGADKDEDPEDVRWEAAGNIGDAEPFLGVTHWVEFAEHLDDIEDT